MREIKFRAWSIQDKKLTYPDEKGVYRSVYESPLFGWQDTGLDMLRAKHDKGEIVLTQYIGLKDKNEKMIYEGDIVTYEDGYDTSTENGYDCEEFLNRGEIFFHKECGRYDVTNKEGAGYDDLFECGVVFEVIGNIYENPELLQEGKYE